MAGFAVSDWLEDRWFIRSHLLQRRLVGTVGFALPVLVVLFAWAWALVVDAANGTHVAPSFWDSVQSSISAYYYTYSANIFVGAQIAFAVFLVTYRYGVWERRVGVVAGLGAAVVGLCPTTPRDPTTLQRLVGGLHLTAAAVFFVGMAVFCLFLFPRDPGAAVNTVPRGRQVLFRVCGVIIVVALLVALVGGFVLDDATRDAIRFLLWLESVAVFAFALAWLVKGQDLKP
ncbi:DUF998 domain-containing protein [Actinomycetospora sp. NBRC 106378]|uniref:DUF998 domain-containing protein n=1 Tax=Actinomycetospora sp. NBRC 106378 TaxID=3032208 RepID=UPI0024A08FEE|nr:DUF998 domain-containing protein [Actinomycetospora sp. NBRC 106378]GLZ51477.1 hypothetical protein Acsp07_10940 [Actinomycetospora sp. NBRC 106378]